MSVVPITCRSHHQALLKCGLQYVITEALLSRHFHVKVHRDRHISLEIFSDSKYNRCVIVYRLAYQISHNHCTLLR